jgi:hypothetical protein
MEDKCASCDIKENLTMHHPDYDYPFQVITLCRKCHFAEHYDQIQTEELNNSNMKVFEEKNATK